MKRITRRTALLLTLSLLTFVPPIAQGGVWDRVPWRGGLIDYLPWMEREKKFDRRAAQKSAEKEAWYADRATDPIGSRQRLIKGKLWPPIPRPTGRPQIPSHRYHAAHYWPYPYYCQDRAFIREFSKRQTSNGWIMATTLYNYHFDPDTDELTRSGREQLRWILENAVAQRRVAFVQTAANNQTSQARLANVTHEAAEMVGKENVPPIMLRVTRPLGRDALEVEQIRQSYLATQPPPRITSPTGGAGGGGYGGGDAGL